MKKIILQPMAALMVALSIAGCSSNNAQEQGKAPSAESPSAQSSEPVKEEKGTRANPIPIGETATVKDGKVTLEITVEEVLRGDDVWTVAKQVDANDTPDTGCEFIVTKVKIKVASGADEKAYNSLDFDFDIFTSKGEGLRGVYAYIPDEQTFITELFDGAEKEAFASYQVKSDDPAPIGRYADTWFALT